MKSIRIGLTTSNLSSLLHEQAYIKTNGKLLVAGFELDTQQNHSSEPNKPLFSFQIAQPLVIEARSNLLQIMECAGSRQLIDRQQSNISLITIIPLAADGKIIIGTTPEFNQEKSYSGQLTIIAQKNKIRLILCCPLEEYVQSVLQSEIPPTFRLEAIKAQAVCARTYALNPRVNHNSDHCDVCDSYLCCQAFAGWQSNEHSNYIQATAQTSGQILTYKDAPILSLFSSCAGGHTENFEDCFSDWATNVFPANALPYLRGVSENLETKDRGEIIGEFALKKLWSMKNPPTVDAWSKKFRWSLRLSCQHLESAMHHSLSELLENKDFRPFIASPPSEIFGHIESFAITKRGIGGTAICLDVRTSRGNWQFKKELTIRSLFKNHSIKLARLPSAKIFFDHATDSKQQLNSLMIYGLGSGHGVGLQQIGAEGLARLNKNYEEILSHYYAVAQLATA